MTRLLWTLGFLAAFIVVVVMFGCGRAPTQAPVCVWDGYYKVCEGDTVVTGGLGTGNNALGARGME